MKWNVAAVTAFIAIATACADNSGDGRSDFDSAPRYTLHEQRRYGSATNPDIGFTSIGALDIDERGFVYAFDNREAEIRVFDTTGSLVRKIGRRGEGPGEFRSSAPFGITGDTLWTLDEGSGSRRITLFRLNGEVIGTSPYEGVRVRLQGARGVGIVYPWDLSSDGFFFSRMTTFTGARPGDADAPAAGDTVRVPRVRWDLGGKLIDTVGWELLPPLPPSTGSGLLSIGGNRYFPPRRPSDQELTVPLQDGAIHIDNSSAADSAGAVTRVTRLNIARDTIFSREYAYSALPYDANALDALAWQSARTPGGGIPIINGVPVPRPVATDSMAAFEAIRAAMKFPAYQRPFQQAMLGRDGTIWLSRYDARGGDTRWIVLSRDAEVLGQLIIPRRTRISLIDGDVLWAVVVDEMDIPWVVKYSLRRDASR